MGRAVFPFPVQSEALFEENRKKSIFHHIDSYLKIFKKIKEKTRVRGRRVVCKNKGEDFGSLWASDKEGYNGCRLLRLNSGGIERALGEIEKFQGSEKHVRHRGDIFEDFES